MPRGLRGHRPAPAAGRQQRADERERALHRAAPARATPAVPRTPRAPVPPTARRWSASYDPEARKLDWASEAPRSGTARPVRWHRPISSERSRGSGCCSSPGDDRTDEPPPRRRAPARPGSVRSCWPCSSCLLVASAAVLVWRSPTVAARPTRSSRSARTSWRRRASSCSASAPTAPTSSTTRADAGVPRAGRRADHRQAAPPTSRRAAPAPAEQLVAQDGVEPRHRRRSRPASGDRRRLRRP